MGRFIIPGITFQRLKSTHKTCLLISQRSISSETVTKNKFRNVFVIGINRPSKRNCINFDTAQQLTEAFDEFENNPDVQVAVLHGNGGNFCAGYDLSEVTSENVKRLEETILSRGPMGPTRMISSKPVIAAVDGYAVAGGLELSLMCDLRVVDETASLGVLNRRFGVPLIDGGTVRLPKMIGLSRALDLVLTGRLISANEAYEWGIANRMVACGTALGGALSLAQSIAKFPQQCLLKDRASIYHSMYDSDSFKEALRFEVENSKDALNTEAIIGAKKFMDGAGKNAKFNIGYDDFNK